MKLKNFARIAKMSAALSAVVLLGFASKTARGDSFTVTYLGAGVQTPQGITTYETFTSPLGAGNTTTFNGSGITGTYSGDFAILAADQYGGAGGTGNFISTTTPNGGTGTYTLMLSQQVDYFGLWFSALDQGNDLYFYNGGTLVAQYNTGVADFNKGKFTPYPAQLSRARVSVEEAPVEILAPDDGIFHFPNQITQHDFDGWVQERGLYFMDQWDSNFKPLLACHDPGESPQKGGLLRAQYGKGTYIYTGYAFFRQLPAGVPGAIRLYVNLLSAGHEKDNAR